MRNKINIPETLTSRFYAVMALLLGFAVLSTAFPMVSTDAVQLQSRQIQMSDSAPSGGSIASGVGSGTTVVYKVSFTTTNTASTIGGIVIDFCSGSPLAGENCAQPTGMLTNRATTTLNNATGMGTGAFGIWTADSDTSNRDHRIVLTRATPATLTSTVSFELGNGTTNGITNPSSAGTFYARIYTYATASAAQAHLTDSASSASYIDYGGVALSTASVITITARVQENITFCMSAAAPSSNCAGTTAPSLILGQGSSPALDSANVSTGNVYSQISTNAISGAIVRIRNGNSSCGGLSRDGGTTCGIPPVNAGSAVTPNSTSTDMDAGTAAFGLAVTSGSGVNASAPYSGSAGSNYFGMDSTTSGSNVTTTFGSQVLACTGPVSNVNNTWTFAATASNTTPSGVYSANITAIATGTF